MYKCRTAAEGTRPRLENTQLIIVRVPKAVSTRNTAVLIASNQITAVVNGGKLSVISLPLRRITFVSCLDRSHLSGGQRSGAGTTGKLRCPSLSTARTANITLSFETFKFVRVVFPASCACSHSGLLVARHTTSYPVAAVTTGSHSSVVSLSSLPVSSRTFGGGPGADARDASVAAFIRATLATYSKFTNFGKSPYSTPFSMCTF